MNRRWHTIGSLLIATGLPLAAYWFKKPRVNQTSDKGWVYWVASPGLFSSSKSPVLKVINIASKPQYLAVRVTLLGADPELIGIARQPSTIPASVTAGVAEVRSSVRIEPRQQIDVSLPPGTTMGQIAVETFVRPLA